MCVHKCEHVHTMCIQVYMCENMCAYVFIYVSMSTSVHAHVSEHVEYVHVSVNWFMYRLE